MIRAIEVLLLTGRPLTAHFAETVAPLPEFDVIAIGLHMTLEALEPRLARRVEEQFAAGVDEFHDHRGNSAPAVGLASTSTCDH